MRYILLLVVLLTGCATIDDQSYYEASKAISKDQTMVQSACYLAVAEIAKSGDNAVKISAIALAKDCKIEGVKLEPQKRSWIGF